MIAIKMPDLLMQPLPDEAHEALRVACVEAISNLTDQSVSMDDFRLALQTLAKLASDYVAALQSSVADRKQLNDRVEALEARTLRGTTGSGSVTSLLGGTVDRTVNLKTPMADGSWVPFVWVDATTGINLSAVTATVTARTATTATVRITNSGLAIAQTVNFTVLALALN